MKSPTPTERGQLHVVVVNDYGHGYGGASHVAISSLNDLAAAGLKVTFVSSVGPVHSGVDSTLVDVVNFGLQDLLTNPSRFEASVRGIWDTRCANGIRKVLLQCDPASTIVHFHSWVKSLSSSVVNVAVSLGFRLVCTLHDYFSVCPNGGLYNFPKESPCLLRPMSLSCLASNCDSRNYMQKLWRVARQVVQDNWAGMPKRLEHFITVSDYSEALLRPLLPAAAKFYRVANPIDIDPLVPASVERNRAFTFVGRISTEKGPGLFASAAHLADVPAVFVGAGPMRKSMAAMNMTAEYPGWLDRAGIIQAIRCSRALVFPSLWHETQGMAVTEAAALGVPAIVSNSCAAREAIIDGETGLMFQSGDVNDLAAKLRLLDRDAALAKRFGLKAYEHYWSAPSTTAMHVDQLISCYREIMR